MKRTLAALAAVFALAAGGADAALLALAPVDCTTVISVDVRRLRSNRDVRAMLGSPGMAKNFSQLERSGVRVADVESAAIFFWDNHWYGVLRVAGAEKIRAALEVRCARKSSGIEAATIAGRRVYRLKRAPRRDGRHLKKELCVTIFEDGAVLVAKYIEVEKFLKAKRVGAAEAARLACNDAEAWLFCRMDRLRRNEDLEGFALKRASLELRLGGAERTALAVTGVVTFADPEKARTMSETLPGILAFFAGLVFSEDPEGGEQVVRALRSEVDGDTLRLSLELPEDLFRRFLRGWESLKDKKLRGR